MRRRSKDWCKMIQTWQKLRMPFLQSAVRFNLTLVSVMVNLIPLLWTSLISRKPDPFVIEDRTERTYIRSLGEIYVSAKPSVLAFDITSYFGNLFLFLSWQDVGLQSHIKVPRHWNVRLETGGYVLETSVIRSEELWLELTWDSLAIWLGYIL